ISLSSGAMPKRSRRISSKSHCRAELIMSTRASRRDSWLMEMQIMHTPTEIKRSELLTVIEFRTVTARMQQHLARWPGMGRFFHNGVGCSRLLFATAVGRMNTVTKLMDLGRYDFGERRRGRPPGGATPPPGARAAAP